MRRLTVFVLLSLILLIFNNCPTCAWPFHTADSCKGKIEYERTDTVSINQNLPAYRFHFLCRRGCYSCDVYVGGNRDTIQHIEEKNVDSPHSDEEIEFADANFDGYVDLLILYNRGNTTNEDYEFWLFNPQSGRFEFSAEYTDKLGCNPSINKEDSSLTTSGTTGCIGMCFDFETYKLDDGRLVLTEHYSQELADNLSESAAPVFVRTLERLENGHMKIIQKVTGTLDEIDAKWKDY